MFNEQVTHNHGGNEMLSIADLINEAKPEENVSSEFDLKREYEIRLADLEACKKMFELESKVARLRMEEELHLVKSKMLAEAQLLTEELQRQSNRLNAEIESQASRYEEILKAAEDSASSNSIEKQLDQTSACRNVLSKIDGLLDRKGDKLVELHQFLSLNINPFEKGEGAGFLKSAIEETDREIDALTMQLFRALLGGSNV